MAQTDRTTDNRDRILRAAERLFAEKGFDATSVASVADAAGVNKALVYYYFESKDHLLASLFDDLLADMEDRAGTTEDHLDLQTKVAREVAYLLERQRMLTLLLMQALKQSDETPTLFKVAAEMIEGDLAARGFVRSSAGSLGEAYQEALVHEFFTGLIPVVAFVTLRDRFCAHFGLALDRTDALFLRALEQSHFASHVTPGEAEERE